MKNLFGFENICNVNRVGDVVLIPYEKTTSLGKGTQNGPSAILSSSFDLEEYDEEIEIDLSQNDICLHEWKIDHSLCPKECLHEIFTYCQKDIDRFSLFIGGEHSLTYSTFSSLCSKDTTLIVLDAHADVADKIDGEILSHGTWLRRLLEDGVRAISVGVRSMSKPEAEYIKQSNRMELWTMHKIREVGFSALIERLSNISGDIYLSVDLDSLDLPLVPSIGSPQPGGFNWYEYCHILRSLFSNENKNIKFADIVEYVPNITFPSLDIVAAKAACKILFWKKRKTVNA